MKTGKTLLKVGILVIVVLILFIFLVINNNYQQVLTFLPIYSSSKAASIASLSKCSNSNSLDCYRGCLKDSDCVCTCDCGCINKFEKCEPVPGEFGIACLTGPPPVQCKVGICKPDIKNSRYYNK